ncbi:MAG: glycosyltransferase [Clostridia bacterium]|nr:glycosyltransferase [Clostridia bacterium]
MFCEVELPVKHLVDHQPYAGEGPIEEIRALARDLAGLRVLHVNSTSYGGGVAELLYTIVPLMRDAGLDAHWQVIEGAPPQFFEATKKIHNTLQSGTDALTPEEWAVYDKINADMASAFPDGPWDVVVIHDPQPLPVLSLMRQTAQSRRAPALVGSKWIWRCHIDISEPLESTWNRLWPYVNEYSCAIVTSAAYARPEITTAIAEITPSIDPTSPKNMAQSSSDARARLAQFGVDCARPLMLQVSRFDPWKDPFGVVEAYRRLKPSWPQLQLAMVGSIALDDPEGIQILSGLQGAAAGDPDIHLLSNQDGVNAAEVAAFQQCADVVVQKSLREGFGLTVTEAMWKARPVVAGRAIGCEMQITDGEDGFLVSSTEECAARADQILRDPALGAKLGGRARETVRRRFLSTGHVASYLRLFARK